MPELNRLFLTNYTDPASRREGITVIDPETMTFREEIIDGKRVHLIDFPEIEAKTFLVYNT